MWIVFKEFIENKKLVSKSQHRSRSEKNNVFTEEVKKIALIANNNTRIKSIDSTEPYANGTSKELVLPLKEIK